MKKIEKQETKTNYTFVLKWLAALAAAALLILSLITAFAISAGTGAGIASMGLALTAGLTFASIGPIIAITGAGLAIIAGLCLIPIFLCKNDSYVVNPVPVYTSPYSPGWGGWGSTIFTSANGGWGNAGTTHGHTGSVFSGSHMHGHQGNMGGEHSTVHVHR